MSAALAETLGLGGPLRVVSPRGALRKLVVFVPEESVDGVVRALAEAGAGVIGDYTECTFRTRGTGTFRGGDETNPYLGERGRLEKVEEVRIETVVPAHAQAAPRKPPPRPTPTRRWHWTSTLSRELPRAAATGGWGPCPSPSPPRSCANTSRARWVFRRASSPTREGASSGSPSSGDPGGSFIPEVAASGADAYVTGDVDYHDALLAESLGLTVIDAGHAATELPSLGPLAERLAELVDVPVEVSEVRR